MCIHSTNHFMWMQCSIIYVHSFHQILFQFQDKHITQYITSHHITAYHTVAHAHHVSSSHAIPIHYETIQAASVLRTSYLVHVRYCIVYCIGSRVVLVVMYLMISLRTLGRKIFSPFRVKLGTVPVPYCVRFRSSSHSYPSYPRNFNFLNSSTHPRTL